MVSDTGDGDDFVRERAVKTLQEFGLTEYQARCFVALARIPRGTAKDVSRLAHVPYPRVYTTVEDLQQLGLVEIQQSNPREFRAIPVEDAIDTLRERYESHFEDASAALRELETSKNPGRSGSWEISDQHVDRRVEKLVDEAEGEIVVVVTDDELAEDSFLERLAAATDDGVEVSVGAATGSTRDRVRRLVPDARLFEWETIADSEWSLGRILMVDRRAALLSSLQGSDLPGVREESAVWAQGLDHGLVVGVSEMLVMVMNAAGVYE